MKQEKELIQYQKMYESRYSTNALFSIYYYPAVYFYACWNTELLVFMQLGTFWNRAFLQSDYKGIVVHCSNICVHTGLV